MGLSTAPEGLLFRSDFKAPSASSPLRTLARPLLHTALLGEGEADTLGEECQGKSLCIWFLEKGNVCRPGFSSGRSAWPCRAHGEAVPFPQTLEAHQLLHFDLSKGPVREPLGPIPPPESGRKEAGCPASACHPQTRFLMVQPQCGTECHAALPREGCHGLGTSGSTWQVMTFELEPLGLRCRQDE